MVAFLTPVDWPVSGENCSVTAHAAPGARVVWPRNWPPPAGPQVENARRTVNSRASAPRSAPCVMPVSVTLPVFLSTTACVGQEPKNPVVHPRIADVVSVVGVSVAAITGVIPVPLSPTGEPATATLAVMVTVPVFAPVVVGENAMVIVQVAPAFKAAKQVPPERAN